MSETVTERPEDEEVSYQGHAIYVHNFSDEPEWELDVPGFIATSETGAYVKCREGFWYQDASGEDKIEAGVLDIVFVSSGRQKGMGALMINFALEEGVRRRLERARTEVRNPKIISIIEKLKAEGTIKSAVYFQEHDHSRSLSTSELFGSKPVVAAEIAKDYLASLGLDEEGYQDIDAVDCVIDILLKQAGG